MLPDGTTTGRALGSIALICLVGVAFVASYVGALHDPAPHGVPVAVSGPAGPSAKLSNSIERGGGFEARSATGRTDALQKIERRDVYASIAIGAKGTRVTVSPASGPLIAETVRSELAPRIRRQTGAPVKVSEVNPVGDQDFNGLAVFYMAIGLVVVGYLGATFLGLVFTTHPGGARTVWRLEAIAVLAILMGILTALAGRWIAGLDGPFFDAALIGMLTVFAVGAATIALQSAFGIIGTGLAILIFVVLGNPGAGGAVPTEMLPDLWRVTGPLIPTGAATDTLRSVFYFPDAPVLRGVIVLLVWALAGIAISLIIGNRRGKLTEIDRDVRRATSG